MGQPEIKVTFSLGAKLLLSLVTLLVIVIAFLSLSTIILFKRDKIAYTYQVQSTQSLLAGQKFVNLSKNSINTLRLSLASVRPDRPIERPQRLAVQSIFKNQPEIFGMRIQILDEKTKTLRDLISEFSPSILKNMGLAPDDLKIEKDWLKFVLPPILKNGFGYINLSKVGSPPVLGVVYADLKYAQRSQVGLPLAIGFVSLSDFGKGLTGSKVTVSDYNGWVLYDTQPEVLVKKENLGDHPLFKLAVGNKSTSGTQEYNHIKTDYIGSYHRPGLNSVVLAQTKTEDALRATYELIEKFFLLGAMAIGFALVFGIIFSKRLTRPLKVLYNATRKVASGKFDLSLERRSRDEIGALTGSFNVMSQKIKELIEEVKEKARIEGEVKIASTVQQTLIPEAEYRDHNVEISSFYGSASECGGDWWGFFVEKGKLCIFIADATGHGIPSALITASARSCFSVMRKMAQEDPNYSFSPKEMLNYANRVIYESAHGQIMMTFWAGVVDFSTKKMTFASAGHNPPWLFKKTGEKFKLKSLVSKGQRLGELEENNHYEEKSVAIEEGDILFLYTDGLLEGTNNQNEQYGKKRSRKKVEAHLSEGPGPLLEQLMNEFNEFNGDKPYDDDVTLAVARFFPPQ